MPDVDGRVLDRLARGRVDDVGAEREWRPGSTLRDVAPDELVRDVVRALRLFGRQDTADLTGRNRGWTGAVRGAGLQAGDAERTGGEAAEPDERAASREPGLIHEGNLQSREPFRRPGSSSPHTLAGVPSSGVRRAGPSRTPPSRTRRRSPAPGRRP